MTPYVHPAAHASVDELAPMARDTLRQVIANDGYAATFQNLKQYREALLKRIDNMDAEFGARIGSNTMNQITRSPSNCAGCGSGLGSQHGAGCPFVGLTSARAIFKTALEHSLAASRAGTRNKEES